MANTLQIICGRNVHAPFQLGAPEPIVELAWLPTIRHDDIVLVSRWRPPSKEFFWGPHLCDMETDPKSLAEPSRVELQRCFRALLRPARCTTFLAKSLDLQSDWIKTPGPDTHMLMQTHMYTFKHEQYVGMQAHSSLELMEEDICKTVNWFWLRLMHTEQKVCEHSDKCKCMHQNHVKPTQWYRVDSECRPTGHIRWSFTDVSSSTLWTTKWNGLSIAFPWRYMTADLGVSDWFNLFLYWAAICY